MNPTIKIDLTNQCVICYNQFKINNTPPNVSHKMYKLCRKYLHSDIMKETLAANWDLSDKNSSLLFCQNCFGSAVELNDLTEQLEFLQKSISELILMFSMGVLNRRGISPHPNQKPNSDGQVSKKLIEMDCSGLNECDSWNGSSSFSKFPSKEPYLELAVSLSDSKTNEYDDPLFGIDDDDDSCIEIKQEDEMDEDDLEAVPKLTKSPVYFPSAAYFTTESDSKMPPVIQIEDVLPPPMIKTVVLAESSGKTYVLSQPPPVDANRNRRKTKQVPLNEITEESNSSNAESTTETEKVSKRLYHLDPKSVQPGRDRRRVQKALNCYKYRLKKKHEAEQTIGKLHSDIDNLKMQLKSLKQNGGSDTTRRRF